MVSLKDISAASGYSVATVSKALNGHHDVGEKTRSRIRQIAEELGYFPNSAAKALKTNRTYNLGILFVDEARSGLTHDYYAALLDSFKTEAEKLGYDLTFINSNRTRPNRMSYLAHARYRGFDGICIACVDFYDPEILELVRSDIPIVTIDHTFAGRMVVQSDNVKGISDLLDYVLAKGHRKIAYLHGQDSAVTQNRIAGFYKKMYENGVKEIPEEYVQECPYRDTERAAELTNMLLDLETPPTCILYPDDFAAFGGMNAIRDRGLEVPADISIAGYDGITIGQQAQPKLTTIAQNTREMGRLAARKLIELIENPRTTLVETLTVPGNLLEGCTVGKI